MNDRHNDNNIPSDGNTIETDEDLEAEFMNDDNLFGRRGGPTQMQA